MVWQLKSAKTFKVKLPVTASCKLLNLCQGVKKKL